MTATLHLVCSLEDIEKMLEKGLCPLCTFPLGGTLICPMCIVAERAASDAVNRYLDGLDCPDSRP